MSFGIEKGSKNYKNKKKKSTAYRVSLYGMMVALAMILGYLETLLPISIGIPGVKPGFPNLVVLVALYCLSVSDAFAVAMLRILLVSLTFGNMSAFFYSLCGGLLSFVVMFWCKKRNMSGKIGLSMFGGMFHNVGQLAAASIVLESSTVWIYLPMLLLFGAGAGAINGLIATWILRRISFFC